MRISVLWSTVRGRLLMAALLVEMVMLSVLVGNSLRLLRDAMGEQAHEQAQQIAPVLSAALVAPMAQYDYATVQAVLDESHAIRGIDYLAVTDTGGAIVATSGWPAHKALPPVDTQFSLDDDDDPPRYDVALPISLAGQALGQLQFGLDLTRIRQARQNLLSQGALIALSELLLSAGLLTLLGLLITRQLAVLTRASLKVAQGQLALEPVPEGGDDVGQLGAAFNVMSRAIAERVNQLTRAKEDAASIAVSLQEKNEQLADHHERLTAENRMRLQAQQELEEALQRLQDRNEQLNAIFDLSPDGFVSFDDRYCIKYASPAFFTMTGMAPADIVGIAEADFLQRLAAATQDPSRFPDLSVLKQRDAGDKEADVPEGQSRRRQLIELSGPGKRVLEMGVRQSDVGTVSQIWYFRDVTHEIEVDRMKSEFLSHAAHELRTPMVSIYGYTELMLAKDFDKEQRYKLLGIILRQSELMIAIINELLDLVRIEERRGKDFELTSVDLGELVRQVVSDFGVPAGQQPAQVQVPEQGLPVRGDRKKLMQAVRNIVSNAYKYSPQGGLVSVSVLHDMARGGRQARVGVRVQDHGMGMTPEQSARVFERFYRADASGNIPGTGLGMSLVKEIIELHGGTVDLQSEWGVGTTVTLWVPVTSSDLVPALPQ